MSVANKLTDIEYNKLMNKLAKETGLIYDGKGDDRLFVETTYFVNASEMDESDYQRMENEIDKAVIETDHYTVYAWNDISGYKYWHECSKTGEHNYIQVTVAIKDPEKADPTDIERDVSDIERKLYHWHMYRFL